jgi:hypothetical protein
LFITILKFIHSNLYWTDWNREAPKIETSSLDGENRRILINKDIGLPNGLTFDPFSKLLCWADAGNTGCGERYASLTASSVSTMGTALQTKSCPSLYPFV